MNKEALLTITIISLSFASHNTCMEQHQLAQYQHDCTQIDTKHKKKLDVYKTEAVNRDLNQEEIIIKNKLISCKKNLLTQKQNALDCIKNSLRIGTNAWESCMQTIKDVEEFNRSNQHLPLPNVCHDETVPKDLLLLITEKLQKSGINPQRVNIHGKQNASYIYKSESVLPSNILKTYPGCSEDKNSYAYSLFSEHVTPGKITINLNLAAQLNMYSKGALCIRIVEDIVQNAALPSMIISTLEPVLTQQPGTIVNSEQFKIFNNTCQKLSIFLPTLNNPVVAACMRQLTKECYFQEFTTNDYNLLSKIERNWLALSWISQKIAPAEK